MPPISRQGRRGDVATIQELPVQSSRAQRRLRQEEHATLREVHDTRTLPAPTHDGASAARHVIAAAQPSTLQASSSALRATSRPQNVSKGDRPPLQLLQLPINNRCNMNIYLTTEMLYFLNKIFLMVLIILVMNLNLMTI
ncbi:hypothetical protein QAD02_012708 [Eretmocerus hayati]|uniref:Uncharacterized protein n=1 Tax=Eretmocerus hayati TaxID=131215 RepID=A0ACC2P1I0_9HYME|nr:hypothetical protein QAD02_012708 [Eretmocerus hayati]